MRISFRFSNVSTSRCQDKQIRKASADPLGCNQDALRHDDYSLVDPVRRGWCPTDKLVVVEPQADLFLRSLLGVAAVDDIAANVDSKVAADGTRRCLKRLGAANESTGTLNHLLMEK